MKNNELDFYSKTNLKSYNLDDKIRYQLSMLDSLDVFTRKHSENVANITCRLCEYLHTSKDFLIYCTTCAYLHDIGKIFIPPNILQKNGPLTKEEFEVIKTHTTIGYKMCMDDPKLRPYAAGPKYHHEALNGTGYPEGLTKKNIPIEGQIIRVADEFDAIVSKRQYKTHVGITDTLKLLIEESKPIVPKSIALKSMQENAEIGKINPRIVRTLCKVVIDDTNYEISNIFDYTKYLDEQIKRLEKINYYNIKKEKTHIAMRKKHFENNINAMLEKGETMRNYKYILEEYRTAYLKRKEKIDNLFDEIKAIKRLRV
ncbi:MAG: HD domain-containing protein [Clostridia bacterium]|nr:HD domain-containing protein [Clostridia bacterium]